MIELTPRQIEIMQLAANGENVEQTAKLLDISPHTTKVHRKAIMRKLKAKTFDQVVAIGFRKGVLY